MKQPTQADFVYVLGTTAQTSTITYETTKPITYAFTIVLKMVNGNPLPAGITGVQSGNSMTITVDTSNTASKGSHNLMVEAKLGPYTKTDTRFKVDIFEITVTPFNIPDITYNVKDPQHDEAVNDIVVAFDPPALVPPGVTWTYSIKYKDNYATALPSFFKLN